MRKHVAKVDKKTQTINKSQAQGWVAMCLGEWKKKDNTKVKAQTTQEMDYKIISL